MKPTFETLHSATSYYSANDKGTPHLRADHHDRILAFANLSGAYGGNARHAEAVNDFRVIAHRTNTQPVLLDAAERFHEWFKEFVGIDTYNEINCDELRGLISAMASARPNTGKYASIGMTDAEAAEIQHDMNRKLPGRLDAGRNF